MNDKVKGLLAGLTIGVMLTGSAAYAAGTQIEVAFKNLKFMFDGVEVKAADDQQSFIYEGTTYVPLRFAGEALGKKVTWDGDTETIWIGKKTDDVVAKYDGGEVTLGQFDNYLAILSLLYPGYQHPNEDVEYKKTMVRQYISTDLLSSRADEQMKVSAASTAASQLGQIKASLSRAGDFATQLKRAGVTESDLLAYLGKLAAVNLVLEASADETALKAEYDAHIGNYTTASVRHILIGFGEAGKGRTKEDALKLAAELLDKLKAGTDFAELAKQYTDDEGSKDNGGLYENEPVNQWVEAFRKACLELELNKLSEPVETQYGYHIMKVESRSAQPFEKVKGELLNSYKNSQFTKMTDVEVPAMIESLNLNP